MRLVAQGRRLLDLSRRRDALVVLSVAHGDSRLEWYVEEFVGP